jgi:rhomboid protease GluP
VDPAQVAGVVADAEHHVRYAPARTPRNAVILLVVANVLMFSLELAGGGSMDEGSLMRLGALMPDLVVAGQAWRLLAAAFLHYGWLHLTMNMFALLVLGPYVESRLGSLRFLLLYLLVGVLDNALYVVLAVSGHAAQELLVGASGAIMGLVGVSAAIFLRGWRQEKSSLARRNLFNMVFLVGLQSVFDLNVPQVSFLCHILGVLTGFGLGWLASQGQTPA